MLGKIYIDDVDLYVQYGLYVLEGGYNELIQWNSLKDISSVDWHEDNGVEPDLSTPVLASRECSIMLGGITTREKIQALISLLSNSVYHTVDAKEIGRTYRLRLVGSEIGDNVDNLYTLTLTFADDFPLRGYTYDAPLSYIDAYDDFRIDSRLFTDYGVRILEGSLRNILHIPDVKENLIRDIIGKSGLIYYEGDVTFKAYDATLHCLMRAKTLDELWRNYDALLYDVTRAGEHSIAVKMLNKVYPVYYKTSEVGEFYATGKIWLVFDITFNVYATPQDM